jgi:hypothetical protein
VLASRRTATRRVVLAGGGAALLAACDLDPRAEPAPAPAPTSGVPSAVSPDADVALRDQLRLGVLGAIDLVESARARYPRLRRPLAGLVVMHEAHLALLDEVGPAADGVPTGVMITQDGPAAALSQVRALEVRHQRELGRMAVRAASGPFARMLASMSAGVAAHLATLAEAP